MENEKTFLFTFDSVIWLLILGIHTQTYLLMICLSNFFRTNPYGMKEFYRNFLLMIKKTLKELKSTTMVSGVQKHQKCDGTFYAPKHLRNKNAQKRIGDSSRCRCLCQPQDPVYMFVVVGKSCRNFNI